MKNCIDNFDEIIKHLSWEQEGDYYYVQIFIRKKDVETILGSKNNSARLIKSYYFYNLEHLLSKKQEIINWCELLHARCGINMNRRNDRTTTLELLNQVNKRLQNNDFSHINRILSKVNGQKRSKDKLWLIDTDSQEEFDIVVEALTDKDLKPSISERFSFVVPTYSGFHIITSKFDVIHFNKFLKERGIKVEIHKNNPTCLYYPSKNK